ncbi:hypothetical protein VULLAG_LOCUS3291 [Vulpes lagopus]
MHPPSLQCHSSHPSVGRRKTPGLGSSASPACSGQNKESQRRGSARSGERGAGRGTGRGGAGLVRRRKWRRRKSRCLRVGHCSEPRLPSPGVFVSSVGVPAAGRQCPEPKAQWEFRLLDNVLQALRKKSSKD